VDQATRGDIAAAAAAHHELGHDYDDAVAESLVDRIGAEIDKRIDARLDRRPPRSRSPAESSESRRSSALVLTGAGIGSGVTGLVAILADGSPGPATKAIITIWVILAFISLAAALVRKYREHG
jgi:hypothetical protein